MGGALAALDLCHRATDRAQLQRGQDRLSDEVLSVRPAVTRARCGQRLQRRQVGRVPAQHLLHLAAGAGRVVGLGDRRHRLARAQLQELGRAAGGELLHRERDPHLPQLGDLRVRGRAGNRRAVAAHAGEIGVLLVADARQLTLGVEARRVADQGDREPHPRRRSRRRRELVERARLADVLDSLDDVHDPVPAEHLGRGGGVLRVVQQVIDDLCRELVGRDALAHAPPVAAVQALAVGIAGLAREDRAGHRGVPGGLL